MRKLNKHQKTVITISAFLFVIVGLIALWILYQYKTLSSPGSDDNRSGFTIAGIHIPSVSGQGHVPGDDYKSDEPSTSTSDNKSSSNKDGNGNSNSKTSSSDPIYTAPNGGKGGSGKYYHVMSDTCYSNISNADQKKYNQEMKNIDSTTESKVTALLKKIDNAKQEIKDAEIVYTGEYAQYNQDTTQRDKIRKNKPSKPYDQTEVMNYANAWSDSTHQFGDEASKIYQNQSNDQLKVIEKYTDSSTC